MGATLSTVVDLLPLERQKFPFEYTRGIDSGIESLVKQSSSPVSEFGPTSGMSQLLAQGSFWIGTVELHAGRTADTRSVNLKSSRSSSMILSRSSGLVCPPCLLGFFPKPNGDSLCLVQVPYLAPSRLIVNWKISRGRHNSGCPIAAHW